MIIGISGKAHAGKDLLASIAAKDGWKRLAFADELKKKLREDFDLTTEHTDGFLKEKPTHYKSGRIVSFDEDGSTINSTLYWTPREMMIEYGHFYRQFDSLYWVKVILGKIAGTNADENYMITDVRFPNEADAIKNSGGFLIRLERHSSRDNAVSEETKKNLSETALDDYSGFDFIQPAEVNKTPEDLITLWNIVKCALKSKV